MTTYTVNKDFVAPGSTKACKFPFVEMTTFESGFDISFKGDKDDAKLITSLRQEMASWVKKLKKAGTLDEDFSIRTLVVGKELKVWRSDEALEKKSAV